MGRKKKTPIVKRVLDERGINYDWFAHELVIRFKLRKEQVLELIEDVNRFPLHYKLMMAIILKTHYSEFNE